MANAITLQPNLSMRFSAGKLSEEDLIKPDRTDLQELNNDGETPKNPEAGNVSAYKEETFCDYIVSICHCSSWLCANLVRSMVLCFENCIEFAHTCKCNNLCCDVCGGSEDSLEEVKEERLNDLNGSGAYDDDYIVCEYTHDIEEELPDSCVIVERRRTSESEKKRTSESEKKRTSESEKKRTSESENKRISESEKKRTSEADQDGEKLKESDNQKQNEDKEDKKQSWI